MDISERIKNITRVESFTPPSGADGAARIFIFTLSTCGACRNTKALLREMGAPFEYVDVDMLPDAEENDVLAEMRKYNPAESFPTIVIGKRVVVGFLENDIKSAVGQLS